MVTCTVHIGIHEGADGRTDVDDVMAIKPNFLTLMECSNAVAQIRYSCMLLLMGS